MPQTQATLYKAHVMNLRSIDQAMTQVRRQLNAAISTRNQVAETVLLRTYLFLMGAWLEVRLLKVIHEPNGFDQDTIGKIISARTQFDSWQNAINYGFRQRYTVNTLTVNTLGFAAHRKLRELLELLETDVKPIIEVRNTLAHGQWTRALNSSMDDFNQETLRRINTENSLSCKFKLSIAENIARLIHELVNGGLAFERDFDKHYSQLINARTRLSTTNYPAWKLRQIEKKNRDR